LTICSLTLPLLNFITRSAAGANAELCVTITTVSPLSLLIFCNSDKTTTPVSLSKAPVGSSQSSNLGFLQIALAIHLKAVQEIYLNDP